MLDAVDFGRRDPECPHHAGNDMSRPTDFRRWVLWFSGIEQDVVFQDKFKSRVPVGPSESNQVRPLTVRRKNVAELAKDDS